MLGKRKRETIAVRRTRDEIGDRSTSTTVDGAAADVFRKYFEATFDPLTDLRPSSTEPSDDAVDDSDMDSSDSADVTDDCEWLGLADEADQKPVVEVIDHAVNRTIDDDPIDKIFQKSFMSSKPPREVPDDLSSTKPSNTKSEEDVAENMNLKHDLDLQRLLRESHLLEQTKRKPDGGTQRHKATDLHLRSLGSKTSLYTETKMPMSHRKGIQAKASSKETQRRKEAKENGVILENSSKKNSVSGSRRERGVDVPVVGRFKGGTLQLSRKDIASIQGPRRSGSKRGRR